MGWSMLNRIGTTKALVTASENGHYNLAISNVGATTYTIAATAQGDQANDTDEGTACPALTLAVNGLAETKTPADCWD